MLVNMFITVPFANLTSLSRKYCHRYNLRLFEM
jgi:hypothetical protein